MPQKKKQDLVQSAKKQSMIDNTQNSLNSKTGYQDTGNYAQIHAKLRASTKSEDVPKV